MITECPRLAARLLRRGLMPLLLSLALCAVNLLPAAAQSAPPADAGFGELSFVDQIGAPVRAVVARAPYAYLAEGRYLTILNVADPVAPVVVRRVLMPETVQDLALSGNYVYVADGASGLRVVDVRDPANAREVYAYTDHEERPFTYVVAGDGYLYLASGSKILSFVAAQPATPRLVNVFDTTGAPGNLNFGLDGLSVAGRYLYLSAGNYGGASLILDIVNPAEPAIAGVIQTRGWALALAVDGDYLYAATGPWGLQIYPRTPDAPSGEIGFYDDDRQSPRSDASAVAVQGRYAYVLAERANTTELRMIDIYNPAAPHFFDVMLLPGSLAGINYSRAIALDGTARDKTTAFIANGYGGLRILDLSSLRELGAYNPVGASYLVAADSTYIYLLGGDYAQGSTLYVLDAADSADPTRLVVRGSVAVPGQAEKMVVAGGKVYLFTWESIVRVVDARDPDHPRVVGRVESVTPYGDLVVQGDIGYLAGEQQGDQTALAVLNLAQPQTQEVVARLTPFPLARGLYAMGNWLYVGEGDRLGIIDISDPADPRILAPFDRPVEPTPALLGQGHFLYAVERDPFYEFSVISKLHVFDLTEPTHPELLGTHAIPGGEVTLVGSYLYTTGFYGTHVIDLSDPTAPVEVASYPLWGEQIGVVGETVYVASRAGLALLRFSPARTASIPASGGELVAGPTTVTFPAAAFTETAIVTITQRATLDITLGSAEQMPLEQVQLTAVYSDTGELAEPQADYTLVFQYEDGEIGALREETLALYTWDGAAWVAAPSSRLNVEANTLTATSTQLGRWLITGETWRGYLPVVQN